MKKFQQDMQIESTSLNSKLFNIDTEKIKMPFRRGFVSHCSSDFQHYFDVQLCLYSYNVNIPELRSLKLSTSFDQELRNTKKLYCFPLFSVK